MNIYLEVFSKGKTPNNSHSKMAYTLIRQSLSKWLQTIVIPSKLNNSSNN